MPPDAESMIASLERLPGDEVVVSIDEYGVARTELSWERSALFLQVGHGWDRVLWTCPSGRTFAAPRRITARAERDEPAG